MTTIDALTSHIWIWIIVVFMACWDDTSPDRNWSDFPLFDPLLRTWISCQQTPLFSNSCCTISSGHLASMSHPASTWFYSSPTMMPPSHSISRHDKDDQTILCTRLKFPSTWHCSNRCHRTDVAGMYQRSLSKGSCWCFTEITKAIVLPLHERPCALCHGHWSRLAIGQVS